MNAFQVKQKERRKKRIKRYKQSDVVAHAFKFSTTEAESGGSL